LSINLNAVLVVLVLPRHLYHRHLRISKLSHSHCEIWLVSDCVLLHVSSDCTLSRRFPRGVTPRPHPTRRLRDLDLEHPRSIVLSSASSFSLFYSSLTLSCSRSCYSLICLFFGINIRTYCCWSAFQSTTLASPGATLLVPDKQFSTTKPHA